MHYYYITSYYMYVYTYIFSTLGKFPLSLFILHPLKAKYNFYLFRFVYM